MAVSFVAAALGDRERFGLALDACTPFGARRSLDWLAGGPPGSGVESLALRSLIGAGLDHPAVLARRLDWLEREGHRAEGGTAALDLALGVQFARAGVAVGMIDEAAGWARVGRAADTAAAGYRSWEVFGAKYLAGKEARDGAALHFAQAMVADLLSQSRSYWRRIAWPTARGW